MLSIRDNLIKNIQLRYQVTSSQFLETFASMFNLRNEKDEVFVESRQLFNFLSETFSAPFSYLQTFSNQLFATFLLLKLLRIMFILF